MLCRQELGYFIVSLPMKNRRRFFLKEVKGYKLVKEGGCEFHNLGPRNNIVFFFIFICTAV